MIYISWIFVFFILETTSDTSLVLADHLYKQKITEHMLEKIQLKMSEKSAQYQLGSRLGKWLNLFLASIGIHKGRIS